MCLVFANMFSNKNFNEVEKLIIALLQHYITVDYNTTRIKNIKNVTRCRDSRSAKSIETR